MTKPNTRKTLRVLVVDDSKMQLKILSSALTKWGYQIFQAENGEDALKLCQQENIDMVISDWMMPGISGLEFCTQFREMKRDKYGYFVLLTSKTDAAEIADGLDAGADDFLTKPVSFGELRARLRAGERILEMQAELVEQNAIVTESLSRIQAMNEVLESDLKNARGLQLSLLPETHLKIDTAEISILFEPCGHVGGDLVGQFTIDENTIGIFSLDVSGHGVASALMTARLSSYLSDGQSGRNIAVRKTDKGWVARSPAETAKILNNILIDELKSDQYFTMVLAILDLKTGMMTYVQAGHPHPVLLEGDGSTRLLGNGGIPIGLIPDAEYEEMVQLLKPGDRVVFYSDGVTESQNKAGQFLDEDGLIRILKHHVNHSGPALLAGLSDELNAFTGATDQTDDISTLVLDFTAAQL